MFAKISQQAHAAAVRGFGQTQQGIELAAHDLFELLLGRALVNHAALVDHVRQAISHPGIGGQAIAARTAGFLVIAFDVLGHVHMGDKAHIGLVDAHAKGNRGAHHHAVFAQKTVLMVLAHFLWQTRVIGQGVDAVLHQSLRQLFNTLA